MNISQSEVYNWQKNNENFWRCNVLFSGERSNEKNIIYTICWHSITYSVSYFWGGKPGRLLWTVAVAGMNFSFNSSSKDVK